MKRHAFWVGSFLLLTLAGKRLGLMLKLLPQTLHLLLHLPPALPLLRKLPP